MEMDFDLRELQYFVAVAEELHFARAAERIGIHQSPLSKAITGMERQLGVRLFVRTRRSTRLTWIGETLLADARRILSEVDRARHGLRAAALGRKGRLCIALAPGVAHPRIARLVVQSRLEDPEMDVRIVQRSYIQQLKEIRSGLLDIGLTLAPCNDHELISAPLWKDSIVAVMRADNPLAKQPTIKANELSGSLIVAGERSQFDADLIFKLLGTFATAPISVDPVASIDLLLTLVATGYGTGLISAAQAETISRSDLAIRPLNARDANITTFILRCREDVSKLVTRFIERAQRMC